MNSTAADRSHEGADDGSSGSAQHSSQREAQREAEMRQIQEALRGLKFGAVSIIVQDGVVIQIDRTEKRRLRRGDLDSRRKA